MNELDTTSSDPVEERQTYDIPEVARMLGLSRGSAYRYAREGRIPVLRLGRRFVVPKHAFDKWLASAAEPGHRPRPAVSDVTVNEQTLY